MDADADLVILGGGCAGLSLGLRLAENPGLYRRIIVLEVRTAYVNDRTWCFWRVAPHRFDPLITASWSRMAIRAGEKSIFSDCHTTPYQMLEAKNFYDEALRIIAGSGVVELRSGTAVCGAPRHQGGIWHIETSNGSLTANAVIDTRPHQTPKSGDAILWQSFLGQEIQSDRPVFDSSTVELMNFPPDSEESDGMTFAYVLPFSSHRALIETTVFGPEPLCVAALDDKQRRSVRRLIGGALCTTGRTESGILPMGLKSAPLPYFPSYSQAGLMSGAARPATGYAFLRIQRWAERCADSIRRGNGPCSHMPDPLLTRAMDRLFLETLRAHPERGADLFVSLFREADTARVIRFLSDEARFTDRVAIAAALPKGLFLRELANIKSLFPTGSANTVSANTVSANNYAVKREFP